MAFVSNTKVGRSAMLASLDETEPCECLETLSTWKKNRNSTMQLTGLRSEDHQLHQQSHNLLLHTFFLGCSWLCMGPTLSISRFFEDRIFFTNHSSLCRRYPPQGYHRQIHWKESPRNVNNNYFNFEIKVNLSRGLLQFPQVKQALWYTLTIFMSLG